MMNDVMHPDQRALLNGIIEKPDCNDRRLIYCDWLEENEEGDICPHCDGTGEEEHTIYCDGDYKIDVRDCLHCNGTGGTSNKFAKWAAFIREQCQNPQSSRTVSKHGVEVVWRRGFIAEVRCVMIDWIRYGPVACRNHPVERVVITDKAALRSSWNSMFYWRFDDAGNGHSNHLPPSFRESNDYITLYLNTPTETEDWLSARCVTLAREPNQTQGRTGQ